MDIVKTHDLFCISKTKTKYILLCSFESAYKYIIIILNRS